MCNSMVWTLCDPIATNALPTIVYYRLEGKKFHSFKSLERNWKEFIWSHAMADWDRGCTSIECHCKEGILVVPLTRQSNPLPPSVSRICNSQYEGKTLAENAKEKTQFNCLVVNFQVVLYFILTSCKCESALVNVFVSVCVCVLSFGCIAFFISTVHTKREACECTTDWVWIERNYFRCCGKFSSLNWQILIRNSQAHPSTYPPTQIHSHSSHSNHLCITILILALSFGYAILPTLLVYLQKNSELNKIWNYWWCICNCFFFV